ncbi:MAG: Glu-tRNA(Gln) amidotransferase subunit GatE [Promethearchaeota archaeon]
MSSASKEEYDYKALGLKVGIEIHQQLDTKGKLFCRCPNKLILKEPDFRIIRTFRPVLGEEGAFDKAMLLEFKKKRIIEYEGYYEYNCTYEYDETPPFHCDEESLDIALEIALLLNLNIVDELHINRKNYVDGSVPAGFQRTMIVGLNGHIPLNKDKILGIEILCLEEDACKKVSEENNKTIFRLDRLGIPLVEVATAPDLNTPEEAMEGAKRIGMLLRGTGRVKRQLGATRQDINVSIKGGERIEIKGVQKLDWIPKLVKNEVRRQLALIKIQKMMKERKITEELLSQSPVDVTQILQNTKCRFIHKGIQNKQKVWGLRVPKMKGLWGIEVQEGRRFGTEVANKLSVITGLKGLIHSDEDLSKYQISPEEIKDIIKILGCEEEDLFVLVLGKEGKLADAMGIIKERTKKALHGVPAETRRALENGNHEFLRDLHGGARLYPDTDSREIIIDKEKLAEIKARLPKYPWDLIPEYSTKYKIKKEIIEELIYSGHINIFNKITSKFSISPSFLASILVEHVKNIKREGYNIDNLEDRHFYEIFKALNSKEIAKESIDPIIEYFCNNPSKSIRDALKSLNISKLSESDLLRIINRIIKELINLIKERGMGAMGPIMGRVMKEVRGKIDGKIVSDMVKKEVLKIVNSSGSAPSKSKKTNPKQTKKSKISKKSKKTPNKKN